MRAAGTDPTLAANWTYEIVPTNLAMTTSYQTFRIENIAIDTASTTNVAVFIWQDLTTTTVGDFAYITDVQLEVGRACTDFDVRPFAIEEALCQRFAWSKTPGTAKSLGEGSANTTTAWQASHAFPCTMRVAPTLTVDDQTRFAVSAANVNTGTATITTGGVTPDRAAYTGTVAAVLTAGWALGLITSTVSGPFLVWDAEL